MLQECIKRNDKKPTFARTETVLDYSMNKEYFAIWTYRQGDYNRELNPSQDIQLILEMAKVLLDSLNEFFRLKNFNLHNFVLNFEFGLHLVQ